MLYYILTEQDIKKIQKQRSLEASDKNNGIYQIFDGDPHHTGDLVPFEVTREGEDSLISGRAILSGNDVLYIRNTRIHTEGSILGKLIYRDQDISDI